MQNFPALHCTIESTMTVLDNSMFDYCSNLFLDCCLEQVGTKCICTVQTVPSEPKCVRISLLFPGDVWELKYVKYLIFSDVSVLFFFKGELMEAIKRDFGSFANFKEKLTAVSVGVQGSGWGWLGYNKEQGRLQIAACANQDPLQGTTGQISFFLFHLLLISEARI